MKVKLWQWVRAGAYIHQKRVKGVEYIDLIAVADDPRDLIQVGDLVKNDYGLMFNIDDFEIKVLKNTSLVTEIWTKIDKDTYKCQWRKENE